MRALGNGNVSKMPYTKKLRLLLIYSAVLLVASFLEAIGSRIA